MSGPCEIWVKWNPLTFLLTPCTQGTKVHSHFWILHPTPIDIQTPKLRRCLDPKKIYLKHHLFSVSVFAWMSGREFWLELKGEFFPTIRATNPPPQNPPTVPCPSPRAIGLGACLLADHVFPWGFLITTPTHPKPPEISSAFDGTIRNNRLNPGNLQVVHF